MGAGLIVSERLFVVIVAPATSFMVTETVNVPLAPGVPEIFPVFGSIDNGTGRPVADQVSGAVPPFSVRFRLYGTVFSPTGSGEVVVIVGGALIVSVYIRVAGSSPRASSSSIVTLYGPVVVGVPEMTPVFASIIIPFGSPDAYHVYLPSPPAAFGGCVGGYDWPTVHGCREAGEDEIDSGVSEGVPTLTLLLVALIVCAINAVALTSLRKKFASAACA